jgi:hypothetical protein
MADTEEVVQICALSLGDGRQVSAKARAMITRRGA